MSILIFKISCLFSTRLNEYTNFGIYFVQVSMRSNEYTYYQKNFLLKLHVFLRTYSLLAVKLYLKERHFEITMTLRVIE